MARTFTPSAPRITCRVLVWASFIAGSAVFVSAGGCTGSAGDRDEGRVATDGVLTTGTGTSFPGAGAGNIGTGGHTPGAVTGGGAGNNPGAVPGTVPPGTGPMGTGGATAPPPPPCVDVEPPPDPEWPDATCEAWANETEECSAGWFAQYCDVSCGRCVPQSGNGGTGTPPGATAEPPACVDVEPPPDPEWPEATCFEWANEANACGEAWFAKYCDVSCGRCVPEGGVPDLAPDCSSENLPNVSGGEGFASRYWDCCQTHCAQNAGAPKCSQDGVSSTGDSRSVCSGGGSFACYNEAPRAVSNCLSYGHIAKANANCGGCYRIQFTGEGQHKRTDSGSMRIKGKQMIVKVSNTGGDVANNQFDLMVPGGGVGLNNGCSRQWGTNELGAQYGGYLAECSGTHDAKKECVRQKCMNIPAGDAREGCLWFVDWFEVADNPKFTSEPTNCPF